jgi:hypothetical protein
MGDSMGGAQGKAETAKTSKTAKNALEVFAVFEVWAVTISLRTPRALKDDRAARPRQELCGESMKYSQRKVQECFAPGLPPLLQRFPIISRMPLTMVFSAHPFFMAFPMLSRYDVS